MWGEIIVAKIFGKETVIFIVTVTLLVFWYSLAKAISTPQCRVVCTGPLKDIRA